MYIFNKEITISQSQCNLEGGHSIPELGSAGTMQLTGRPPIAIGDAEPSSIDATKKRKSRKSKHGRVARFIDNSPLFFGFCGNATREHTEFRNLENDRVTRLINSLPLPPLRRPFSAAGDAQLASAHGKFQQDSKLNGGETSTANGGLLSKNLPPLSLGAQSRDGHGEKLAQRRERKRSAPLIRHFTSPELVKQGVKIPLSSWIREALI
ncbi:MAG: hypothetical protein LBJ94_02715 [Puniceicoccales bacterium]|jgi:hypothetical protein|nr:hypothetical protein [Puniceicoccales bacterium]